MSSRRPSASLNASAAYQQSPTSEAALSASATASASSSLAPVASSSSTASLAHASANANASVAQIASASGSSAPLESASNHSLAKEMTELSFSILKCANTPEPSSLLVHQEASASVQSCSSTAASAVASNPCVASGRVSSASVAKCVEPVFLSEIETLVLRSERPISVNETEQITVLGNQGIWSNRSEVLNWQGELPIESYKINEDPNPEVITKIYEKSVEYIQELAVRYLRPPRAPSPGEIIIKQVLICYFLFRLVSKLISY